MISRLGELLVEKAVISDEQLKNALESQRLSGGKLAQNLVKLGYIQETDITHFLGEQYRIPVMKNLSEMEINSEIVNIIPFEIAQKYQLVPIEKKNSTLIVAMVDPSNIFAIDDIKFLTGYNIEVVVASETDIKNVADRYYDSMVSFADLMEGSEGEDVDFVKEEDEVNVSELQKSTEEAPVVKLVNMILVDAIRKGASDIHIEPYEKMFRVRYRIDGLLYEVMRPPLKLKNSLTSRIKIMSKLDISERRLPQDGRIKLHISGGKFMDFRVSVLPTLFGEKVVLRLLDTSNLQLDMTKLGFEEKALKAFKEAIYKPYGMVLVTGPTGSGKTTTLYSAMTELNKVTENISTAEDPIEFNLPGINQVQMHDNIGLNFAAALRSFLRQDPDIIMVGEIRDLETAEIAVKAALTGHLVLSTLHTNDAPSTINRMLNMGVEPFLVSSSVNLIVAQRLARRICENCKEPHDIFAEALLSAGMSEEEINGFQGYIGRGCGKCNNTGYKGRIALYEVLELNEEIR
ncbi:MAG: type IV-A pilus assembly ATPase PilB, partial [Thermodesulfobacteriota bacterium]|nr:type IV-A pilus assembly ATPase PilB [Thermodesulfobacteriota bacterium]